MRKHNQPVPGQRFGRLTVVSRDGSLHSSIAWLCMCDCGATKRVRSSSLVRAEIVSCGCYRSEVMNRTRHGMRHSAEWKSWDSVIQRTENEKHKSYALYGGRGIKMCARWRDSFEAFFADMGRRPSRGHSIDRYPDQNGDYEPGNCRWATSFQQNNNRRDNVAATINGRTQTASEWALETGLNARCIAQRISRGEQGVQLLRASNRGRKYPLTAQGEADAA